jgi:hypothetical protein
LNIISSFPPLWAYAVEKQELFSNSWGFAKDVRLHYIRFQLIWEVIKIFPSKFETSFAVFIAMAWRDYCKLGQHSPPSQLNHMEWMGPSGLCDFDFVISTNSPPHLLPLPQELYTSLLVLFVNYTVRRSGREQCKRKEAAWLKLLTSRANNLGKTAHQYIYQDRSLEDVTGG